MKTLLAIVLALFAQGAGGKGGFGGKGGIGGGTGASASFAVVHVTTFHTTSSSGSNTITIPSTTGGNTLLIAATLSNSSFSAWATTPTSTALLPGSTSVFGNAVSYLGASANISGGLTSVTVTNAGSSNNTAIVIAEVSGLGTSVVTDGQSGQAALGSAILAFNTGSVTTANGNDVILSFTANGFAATTYTAGSGYTVIGQTNDGSLSSIYLAYQTVSSTGSYNPSVTQSSTNDAVIGTVAVEY